MIFGFALFIFVALLDQSSTSPAPTPVPRLTPRIIGGEDATPYEFPFITSIRSSNGGFCGGSLIAPSLVLTAAHCCNCSHIDDDSTIYTAYINLWQTFALDGCTDIRSVSGRRCHPDYVVGNSDHDFCLLSLDAPSSYPIALLYDSTRTNVFDTSYRYDDEDSNQIIAGFGVDTTEGQTVATRLQKASIKIAHMDQCLSQYQDFIQSGERIFTAEGTLCGNTSTLKDTCLGDSGGPLMARHRVTGQYILVGVTSAGPEECADRAYSGLYSKINTPSFRDFAYGPTRPPTPQPTHFPTLSPTLKITLLPSSKPTQKPTLLPTWRPSSSPTRAPSRFPTKFPTFLPTRLPTNQPTSRPTRVPTAAPSRKPTLAPTLRGATKLPTTRPTRQPTRGPTVSKYPTKFPTKFPTKSPTAKPTRLPTRAPTGKPTRNPTLMPTRYPTKLPTSKPSTHVPSNKPTKSPTSPTSYPTTLFPTSPTKFPTTPYPSHVASCIAQG